MADQWVQRSEEGHWVEEEYFQESKNLLEKVEEDLNQGALAAVDREEELGCVVYIGEATGPVQCPRCLLSNFNMVDTIGMYCRLQCIDG